MRYVSTLLVLGLMGCGSLGSDTTAEGECVERPFGLYEFKTAEPICDPGENRNAATYSVAFGSPMGDGGTGVTVDGRECAESWQGCRVLVVCASSERTFDLTYSAKSDGFSGAVSNGCSCTVEFGGSPANCDIPGADE